MLKFFISFKLFDETHIWRMEKRQILTIIGDKNHKLYNNNVLNHAEFNKLYENTVLNILHSFNYVK